jgi:hypothetical protein
MTLLPWFILLVIQNASFTWVSRARNSGSYGYHAIASVFSNGIWFISQFLLIGMVTKPGMPMSEIITLACVYISATVIGSVSMHYISINYLEKGSRKVGA